MLDLSEDFFAVHEKASPVPESVPRAHPAGFGGVPGSESSGFGAESGDEHPVGNPHQEVTSGEHPASGEGEPIIVGFDVD